MSKGKRVYRNQELKGARVKVSYMSNRFNYKFRCHTEKVIVGIIESVDSIGFLEVRETKTNRMYRICKSGNWESDNGEVESLRKSTGVNNAYLVGARATVQFF